MQIKSIPMCKSYDCFPRGLYTIHRFNIDCTLGEGSSDNYAYLVVDDKSKDAVIIDPAHPEE